MDLFSVDCELNYQVNEACTLVFNIAAKDGPHQRVIDETITTVPTLAYQFMRDVFGNRLLRVCPQQSCFSIRYQAMVEVDELPTPPNLPEIPVSTLPETVWSYLMPSRFCQSDVLFKTTCRLFGNVPTGTGRVMKICEWIKQNIDYVIGSSNPHYSAKDVLMHRAGVCRDFAHLAITFCRALNIPARMVTTHAMWDHPPADFHALFEAYLGGEWVLFDPTFMAKRNHLVRIATGRDASDVAFATLFGNVHLTRMNPLFFRYDEQLAKFIDLQAHVLDRSISA